MNDPADSSVKAPQFPATGVGEVFGSLAFAGEAKTIEEMDAAVADEARRAAAEDATSRRSKLPRWP